jgi:hypothetical protein
MEKALTGATSDTCSRRGGADFVRVWHTEHKEPLKSTKVDLIRLHGVLAIHKYLEAKAQKRPRH